MSVPRKSEIKKKKNSYHNGIRTSGVNHRTPTAPRAQAEVPEPRPFKATPKDIHSHLNDRELTLLNKTYLGDMQFLYCAHIPPPPLPVGGFTFSGNCPRTFPGG